VGRGGGEGGVASLQGGGLMGTVAAVPPIELGFWGLGGGSEGTPTAVWRGGRGADG
jgi:hypothetical protein